MDKKILKEFAVMARNELRQEIALKAKSFGVDEDNNGQIQKGSDYVIINGKTYPKAYEKAYEKLIELKKEKGFDELIEEVAYTWFNRIIAIRFMEVNEYLPSYVRVLSSKQEGKVDPDILEDYRECDLDIDEDEIEKLINSGDNEGAYRKLLIAQCNKLSSMMPFLFEEIHDYTEMLLPDKLLIPESIIKKLVNTISEDDFKEQVEIIGWIYQYYISEKKDEVFAGLKKNIKITKENIPAATQLFTPDWIVKYMVENSLGRLWLEGHPDAELQSRWKYYLEEAEQEPEVEEELKKVREEHSKLTPEDIKVLDPCMGSGHILVYAFDVLYEIYLKCGYAEKDIPRLILEKNIYGLDIDDRAAQLAGFALMMKARSYSKRFFRDIARNPLELNVCAIQESRTLDEKGENQISGITQEEIDYFANGDEDLKRDVEYLVEVFTDAKEYGSILEVKAVDFDAIKLRLDEIKDDDNLMFGDYRNKIVTHLPALIKQTKIMCTKYEICSTNPPYMGLRNMDDYLVDYVKNKYPKNCTDLFSVFIEKGLNFCKKTGFNSMVTMQSWMFLSSFEEMRKNIIKSKTITNLLHMDNMVMGIAFGTSATVFRNIFIDKYKATYNHIKLKDIKNNVPIEFPCKNERSAKISSENFLAISGSPIAYWASQKTFEIFRKEKPLGEIAKPRQGVKTLNNDYFMKKWFEVSSYKISYYSKSFEEAKFSGKKWFPYTKGGDYRKWYGNNEYVVNWENDGLEMKEYAVKKYNSVTRTITNLSYWFKSGLTWSMISSGNFSLRYVREGFGFDARGSMMFMDDNIKLYILGLLCSNIVNAYLDIISPTISFEVGNISKIPVIINLNEKHKVDEIVKGNLLLSQNDWDSFETSWDFKVHPLLEELSKGKQYKLSSIFNQWQDQCEENFNQLKSNEEELNRIFIDIYGLQDELTPEVEDKDITIRKADRERDIKSLISYAVGCMFGRYSIDAEGLIYAGGDFEDKWNLDDEKVRNIQKDDDGNVISDSWTDASFMPDKNNIIPITENEYFEDDIVSRFVEFIKIVYGEDNLKENLDYIADTLVKKNNESSKERIRRYFVDDFFKDHCKIYQKRPIYWLVDSGKNKGFKALIYLHRYNEDTLPTMRLNYLLELQGKYMNEEKQVERNLDSGSLTAGDKKKLTKQLQALSSKQNELVAFDKVLDELANEKIELDLDDGVVVNYKKLQPILAKIK